MTSDFATTQLGTTGLVARRLGLSASYWPGRKTVHEAIDNGVNVFFLYGFDRQMVRPLRELLKTSRDKYIVVTGAYNLIWTHTDIRKTYDKRLRQLGTDYIDFFLFLGVMKPAQLPERVIDELVRLREEGKVRGVGLSCHDRRFVGQLMADGRLDTAMMRYNAAHRGAEVDIFPHLATHDPTVISYTATRWGFLLRRPKNWSKEQPLPTGPMCYRFVLSNPNVDIALTAPRNVGQLRENLKALEQGPLSEEEMGFMRRFGDVVHEQKKWFM